MQRGAIASDKVRAPGPVLDDRTIADLDDLISRLEADLAQVGAR
jgi:hypothetical protein